MLLISISLDLNVITKYVSERDQKSREIYILAVYPMFLYQFSVQNELW